MKFTNLDQKKNYMEEEIERLRLDIIKLHLEKDKVLSEIEDQRRGKQTVAVESQSIKSELVTIESILTETQKALEKQSHHFANLTEKQKDKIQSLNTSIQERLDELALQEGKELIDVDSENRKIKKELNIARKELQKAKDDAESLKNERVAFEKEKQDTLQAINEERAKYECYMGSLEKREQKIVLSEKRLEKYKAELLSKK